VLQLRKAHIQTIQEIIMNWVFEAYSNVYNTALMAPTKPLEVPHRRSLISKVFGKR
jgi:hypothetical protein